MLTLDELRADVETGAVDTVIAAFTDMQGRLMGKRLDADFFLSELEDGHGSEGCNYLLALEMEMEPVPGYAIASWERGYGDFGLMPDLGTLRRVPWHEATAMVQCDVEWHDGTPVGPSPRQVLKAQVEKARGLGYEPMFGSELEFFLFRESYAEAHAQHYHDLTPSVPYILDYHILGSSYDEPFLREVRTSMKTAGMRVESSKGEAWAGQHEINFRYADALKAADDHVVYKTGIKEIAYQRGCSVTFMAKPDHAWVGSSCHIHSSLWQDGKAAFAGESDVFKHYLAGQIACAAELAIFYAPTKVTTTARAVSGSSARARRCVRRRVFPAPTRTRISPSRHCLLRVCTGSSRSSSWVSRSRAMRTSRTRSGSRTPCATRSPSSSRGRSLGSCSATT